VHIPGGWSFEESAQLGVVVPLTALQCLHEALELPSPFEAARLGPPLCLNAPFSLEVALPSVNTPSSSQTPHPDNGLIQRFRSRQGTRRGQSVLLPRRGVVENIRAATGNALDIAIRVNTIYSKDPRYGKGQAYPGFHSTQWNCWSEGLYGVHAGWKGKSDARLIVVYASIDRVRIDLQVSA